jgi:hypothetical protein
VCTNCVISTQEVLSMYGADTVRLHLYFAAPPDFPVEWFVCVCTFVCVCVYVVFMRV